MVTVNEIRELKEWLVNNYHSKRVTEQETDQKYIDDTFTVPYIKEAVNVVRTGKGYRMCSAPAEHIITSNPQLFRKQQKDTAGEKDKADPRGPASGGEVGRWKIIQGRRDLRRNRPRPTRPEPRSQMAAGTGTGLPFMTWKISVLST